MKIVMLNDVFDEDVLIWNKGDIFEVEENDSSRYILKTVGEVKFAISKCDEGVSFIKINESK